MLPFPSLLAAAALGLSDLSGVLLQRGTSNLVATNGLGIEWNTTPVFDHGGFFNSAAPSKITIPAGTPAGTLVKLHAAFTAGHVFAIYKNGAVFNGMAQARSVSFGDDNVSLSTAVLSVQGGDYFELVQPTAASTGPPTSANGNWFGLEVLDSATRYALVRKNATQSIGANTTVEFQTEVADVGGWFGTNATDFVVPSGVTRVRVSACVQLPASSNQLVLTIAKNGAATHRGFGGQSELSTVTKYQGAVSAVLDVTPGDVFTLSASSSTSLTMPSQENVWFCIEEVPDYDRTRVYRSANQTLTANATTVVSFDNEEIDTAGAWASGSQVIVPSGYTQARVAFGVDLPSGAEFMAWTGSGTRTHGCPHEEVEGGSSILGGMGPWIDVTTGQVFDMRIFITSGSNVTMTANPGTWLEIEFR